MIQMLLVILWMISCHSTLHAGLQASELSPTSIDSSSRTWCVEWRTDLSTPLVRLAWTMPTRGIRPEVLFMLVHYVRFNRPKDSVPMRIGYRPDLPNRVIWELVAHVQNLDVLLQTLIRDVTTLELTPRRLAFTLMQIERLLDQPRSSADWFIERELQPVLWGEDQDFMLRIPSYRQLRRVQVEDLIFARNVLMTDSVFTFVGTGPLSVESIRSKLSDFSSRILSSVSEVTSIEKAIAIPSTADTWPCDTSWVSLQEDAGSPLVVHAWIWPVDSLRPLEINQLRRVADWLESHQSSFHREWIASQRLYQARFQLLRSTSRFAWLSYSFPRIDQVEDARDLLPESLRQCLRDDSSRIRLTEAADAFISAEEDPQDWMESVYTRIRAANQPAKWPAKIGQQAVQLLDESPCITAILINSRHARQAGIEPDESGAYQVSVEPETTEDPRLELTVDEILLPDTSQADTFPSDLLSDVVLYFDSRYPEIRDERLQLLDQVIETLNRYPDARLVIYGSVVNRREINSDLIGKMWAEYIRDYLVQQRRVPTSRLIPQAGLLLDQPYISRRWDRRISFQLISN